MNDLISRQDAIDALMAILDKPNHPEFLYTDEICRALNQLPSAQPSLDEWCTDCKEYDSERHCCPRWNRVIRETLKDAQPERKKGKWKATITGWPYCSECDWMPEDDEMTVPYGYCPNCGARMEEEAKEKQ